MMKQLTIGLMLLLLPTMLFAQAYQKKTPEEKARKYTLEMMTEIPLEKEQEPAIYSINLEVSRLFDSLYASHPDKDVMRNAMIAIFRQRDAALRTVMSPQQFLRFDDLQREKRRKKIEKQQQENAGDKQTQ